MNQFRTISEKIANTNKIQTKELGKCLRYQDIFKKPNRDHKFVFTPEVYDDGKIEIFIDTNKEGELVKAMMNNFAILAN